MNYRIHFLKALLPIVACLLVVTSGCSPQQVSVEPETPPPTPPPGFESQEAAMAAVLAGKVPLVQPPSEMPPAVAETKDIEYGKVGDRALLLDLYLPKDSTEPLPGIIFIHGGGWKKGDRGDYKYYTVLYAQEGYACATISYRFSTEAKFPAAVEDAKCAVRWMRANAARYNIDPNRIAVLGGSAGGYLSMMVGYTADDPSFEGSGGNNDVSSAVQAVIDFYGPTDLTTEKARTFPDVIDFIGKSYDEAAEMYVKASPITHAKKGCPPTLIFDGTIDELVPVAQAEALAEKLRTNGVPCELEVLQGWPHTMDAAQPANDYCRYFLDRFLREYLGGPK